ncbi:MAG: beta-ketoacyl synthase chain length factor, partial [Desulfatitalea sp.]|nr:beta-ketoacyl synthase chain length factor [Desulfatitalea sp.]
TGCDGPPDAIVLGSTTGGIFTTETLLAADCKDPAAYRNHALTTVAEELAGRCGCTGPVITVSTACSSGAVAIKVAMEMLRSGLARKVLAGGADSLCRLTYFGFKSLQLIDPAGARPLDLERRGMSVAEGAAMLLLAHDTTAADGLRVLGAGLSCDAHHATAPHPDGAGALAAMGAAMADARLAPGAIDYINLHGTGTPDNDLAEGRAIRALFGEDRPPLSSIKGTTGHPLAAAGAIEAVVSALCIRHGLLPANVGYRTFDAELGLEPVAKPTPAPLATVMSNSFGFGGNNATLIVGTGHRTTAGDSCMTAPPLVAEGFACITGAGRVAGTRERFFAGESCAGCLDEGPLAEGLPPRTIRRFKRLPRMALALAVNACEGVAADRMPGAVSLGTAWGALTETHDFLRRLAETGGQFPSPTDFVGSVHNAPAGQIAMHLGIRGANVTTSGGDASFEQALLVAGLLAQRPGTSILVTSADEYHPVLSRLFDPSVRADAMADGGGALLLRRSASGQGPVIQMLDYRSGGCPDGLAGLVSRLGGADAVNREYGVILAGLPAGSRDQAEARLAAFVSASRFGGPVVDYRRLTGEFGSASAVAAVMGVAMARQGVVPGPLAGGTPLLLQGKSLLLLGLGTAVTAVRIAAP